MSASPWNSLEVARLAVSAITPIVVVGLGVAVSRAARRIESADWLNRELIQRRLQLYDRVAPMLNELFCFFCLRGAYRNIRPPDAVNHKRRLDAEFHINQFLFSDSVRARYADFIDVCFRTFTGTGQDAKLRADIDVHRSERRTWEPAWDHRYVSDKEYISAMPVVAESYNALMESLARDIGVVASADAGRSGDSASAHVNPRGETSTHGSGDRAASLVADYDASEYRICSTCGIAVPAHRACPQCGELD